jgi:segregation and condensation protein B
MSQTSGDASQVADPLPADEATGTSPALVPAPAAPTPDALAPVLEAVLLSSDKPLAIVRLAEVLGLAFPEDETPTAEAPPDVPAEPAAPDAEPAAVAEPKPRRKKKPKASAGGPSPAGLIKDAVAILNAAYEQTGRSFRIEAVAGGYRVMMLPQFAPAIAALQGARARTSLSQAALESLAIIAYKQPMTRARLEAIRGVACGEILRSLTERRLVTITGRADEVGRPLLYGTTKRFLELFGLANLKDLPSVEDLRPKA